MPINGGYTKLCGAKTRSGKPCTQIAMSNSRCKMHGGKSLIGSAHPRFKHGRYSKAFSGNLLERYKDYLRNPLARENLEAMAVLQVMIDEDIENLIANGNTIDQDVHAELRKNLDLQTRIYERDTRSRVLTKQMVTLDEVLILAAKTKEIIERYVSQDKRAEFERDFQKILE